jgi:hypothetical protein
MWRLSVPRNNSSGFEINDRAGGDLIGYNVLRNNSARARTNRPEKTRRAPQEFRPGPTSQGIRLYTKL